MQDFAGPSRSRTSEQEWSQRRFNAKRFVLVTGCVVNDRHVEDELVRLQDEYTSDLEIELYDNGQLSRMLRDRGSLVSGIFGPEWARAFCGYDSPAVPTTPSGRALLNDPVEILGYGELLVRAESLLTNEAAAAAELYAELSRRMDEKAFFPRAEQLRALQRDAHEAAGNTAAAFEVTMRLLLDRYDTGQHLSSETARTEALAEALGSPATDVARVGAVLAPLAGRLVVAVAEQIVTDDDSADDPEPLCTVASNLVDRLTGTLRTRLECCIADLTVRTGTDPTIAFADLTRRAYGGHIAAPLAALVLRRAARAQAFAGRPDDAIDAYRRAVLDTAEADLGGDARDALRSISYLSSVESRQDAMDSVRSLVTRDRLLPGADHAALSALEYLVDEKLPDALRESHQWVWHERISGALLGEVVARRRYGEVFARAGEPAAAVPSFSWRARTRTPCRRLRQAPNTSTCRGFWAGTQTGSRSVPPPSSEPKPISCQTPTSMTWPPSFSS